MPIVVFKGKKCAREFCQQIFIPTSSGQTYCSRGCSHVELRESQSARIGRRRLDLIQVTGRLLSGDLQPRPNHRTMAEPWTVRKLDCKNDPQCVRIAADCEWYQGFNCLECASYSAKPLDIMDRTRNQESFDTRYQVLQLSGRMPKR